MANWSEYIQSRPIRSAAPEKRPPPTLRAPAWLTDWESWLTFALVLMVFLSVARSIDDAGWVAGMPSLIGLSFIGLFTGLLLARVRAPEIILHVLALLIGAAIVFYLTIDFIGAPTLRQGAEQWMDRWRDWIAVVRRDEPTGDNMPFVMGVLALTWFAAYLSAWSIFRWRNAWLALIPGGVALLTNISYLPSQFSSDFVIFLFGAMLLVMRVHMLNKLHEWKRTETPYPDFLSLSLLNVTTWVALAALIAAWSIPQANEIGFFSRAWERVASPFTGDQDRFVRLFSSIDAKKEVPLHTFGDTLPLQGRVVLDSRIAAQVEFGEGSNEGRPLRAKVYDTYTPAGWKGGSRADLDLAPLEQVQPGGVPGPAAQIQVTQTPNGRVVVTPKNQYKDRIEVTANFVEESGLPKGSLPSIGQPSTASVNSKAEIVNADGVPDVDAVRSRTKFKVGDAFVTTGTISVASAEKLRGAGAAYPQYIRDRYLQLPDSLPPRVRQLSADLTKDRPDAYDKAKAIEEYLRTFPTTFDIRSVPPGRDAVDFFLFDEKKGYFDYQASAMVVLLRAAGVPARLAVGYTVEEFDVAVRRYLLRDSHAYAWPEVFFPGYGWVEFSPYGSAPVIDRPQDDGTTSTVAGGEGDYTNDVPSLDFGDIMGDGESSSSAYTKPGSSPFAFLVPVLFVLMGLVAVGGIAGITVRVAWERGMSGLDYPSQLWEKTIRLATWLRLGPKPNQTPTEYSRALQKALPMSMEGVDVVAESYQRSRYGHHELTADETERLDATWPSLRNRLIKRVLRWKS